MRDGNQRYVGSQYVLILVGELFVRIQPNWGYKYVFVCVCVCQLRGCCMCGDAEVGEFTSSTYCRRSIITSNESR